MATLAPIPKTDWFPEAGHPEIIARVVEVPVIHRQKSKAERREVYVTFPAFEHKVAGVVGDVSFSIVKEEADPDTAEALKRRFAAAWAAYKEEEIDETEAGTAIELLDGLPANKAEEFVRHGLTTIEQLAIMSDANCESVGLGAKTWRANARKFLRRRQNGSFGLQG